MKITQQQLSTILVCFLMNMLDGMNVMIISYAAPSMAKAWLVKPEIMGLVFSTGLVGMAIGAMFLAPQADKIGRRLMILICTILMGVSVFASAYCPTIEWLIGLRLVSGLGIGGMLVSTATLSSEYAPKATKSFWVSFVMGGYPIGAVLTGLVAAKLIPQTGWQGLFRVAGVVTFSTLPLIYFFLSESLDFLLKSQPTNALEKINSILTKMKQPTIASLPKITQQPTKTIVTTLLKGNLKVPTLYLWLAIFMAFATLYFLTSWIPKLATTAGLSVELAIYAGTVFNLGAFAGIVTQGYLSGKFGLNRTIFGFLMATTLLMAVFGFFTGSNLLLPLFGLIGFGIQGGFVGLYSVAAGLYPTQLRATGVGWGIGMGRIGGIVGPLLGGVMIGAGLSMTTNFLIFAVPTLIAGLATLRITTRE